MIDQHELAGDFELEVDDRGAARRHGDGLHVADRLRGERTHAVDAIEHLADNMEGRGEVRAAEPR